MEASVVNVNQPGERVEIIVEFTKNGVSLGRETIVFLPNEKMDMPSLQAKIDAAGNSLNNADNSASFAKTVAGAIFTVNITDASIVVPVNPAPKV